MIGTMQRPLCHGPTLSCSVLASLIRIHEMMVTDTERDDALIQAIYAGPLEDHPWRTFLRSYRQSLCALDIGLAIRIPQLGRASLWLHDCTTDPRHIAQYHQTYFRQDPWHTYPMTAGEVTTMDKVITPDVLQTTPFFREFMHAHGALYGMKATIASDEQGSAFLLVGRSGQQGNFTTTDQARCRRLLPHLQQALRCYQALVRAELQNSAFMHWSRNSHLQALWLDAQGCVLPEQDANSVFARLPFLKIHEHRPYVLDAGANAALQSLIRRGLQAPAPADGLPQTLGHIGLGGELCDGSSLAVQRLPQNPGLGEATPKICLWISTGQSACKASSQAIAQVFGLSPAEAEVALLLAQGHSLRSAAQTLAVSEHTVRTQTKKIYARTGCAGQVELLRSILGSTAITV